MTVSLFLQYPLLSVTHLWYGTSTGYPADAYHRRLLIQFHRPHTVGPLT